MKKLFAMDIGNSRTGFALFSGKRLGRIRHVATHDISDVASAAEFLKSGIASGDDIKAAWVASVVPQKNRMVATALRNLLGIDAHIMTPRDVPMPVEGYDLSQIGIDRLINAFAAYDLTKSACIVVDAGSCITFDCVSDEGVYLGGGNSSGAWPFDVCDAPANCENSANRLPDRWACDGQGHRVFGESWHTFRVRRPCRESDRKAYGRNGRQPFHSGYRRRCQFYRKSAFAKGPKKALLNLRRNNKSRDLKNPGLGTRKPGIRDSGLVNRGFPDPRSFFRIYIAASSSGSAMT